MIQKLLKQTTVGTSKKSRKNAFVSSEDGNIANVLMSNYIILLK